MDDDDDDDHDDDDDDAGDNEQPSGCVVGLVAVMKYP